MRESREKSAVLLDRHPLWLDAMEALVEGVGIDVVGRATDSDEAIELIDQHRPDLFIASVDVASSEQVTCIRRAKDVHPELKSVVVGDNTNPEEINSAFVAGASVYCVKTADQDDLASAIRQVFERSIYLATNGSHAAAPAERVQAAAVAAPELTRRELEILQLVAEGYSNSQLAKMLWVTEQTVKFHLSNIYRKLDVANRTEASRWAQLNGLLGSERPVMTAA
jgi:DNA-binding NarL/FixJ family response regulator